MDSLSVPTMEPSAANGVSSTNNGDDSIHITQPTSLQNQSQLRIGDLEKSQPISAGTFQYTRCSDLKSPTFWVLDEIALYDRQIRLWGVRAQER